MLVNLSLIFRIPLDYGGVVNAQIGYAAGNCPDRQTAISKNDWRIICAQGKGRDPGRSPSCGYFLPFRGFTRQVEANISRPYAKALDIYFQTVQLLPHKTATPTPT